MPSVSIQLAIRSGELATTPMRPYDDDDTIPLHICVFSLIISLIVASPLLSEKSFADAFPLSRRVEPAEHGGHLPEVAHWIHELSF